ncbi:MAG: glycosyltransferase family 4 protein [Thaumarchaeota archaeon]|jgi:glycosyltransferase involved in cell wall biosynthesis|nr:glycosyltransferase family 4 protein [Nitrososphaerota archaeon]
MSAWRPRVVNILIPFYNVEDLDFYYHLVESLRRFSPSNLIHIVYVEGIARNEWELDFSLHKLKLPRAGASKSLQLLLSKRRILEQLKGLEIDVIFVLSELWTLEFSSYCSAKLSVPFVVWVRGDHRRVRELRRVNRLKRALANYLEVKYLNRAAFVVPNCVSLRRKLRDWGVDESKITDPVHNGVDTSIFRPLDVPRSDRFTVGYAGRICPEKRVTELLKVAQRLKGEDVEFLVAGSKAMDVSFPENVRYLGKLPFKEMPRFYNMIDLLVLPSATEGFPSVILEAYACERPVLASKEALPEELKVFGSVVDVEELGEEILRLKSEDLKELGKRAREYVRENFTWERFARKIVEYLKKAASKVGEVYP